MALAYQHSPVLTAAEARTEGARAGIDTARAYANPQFNILGGQQHGRPILTPGVPGVLQHYSIQQPLEIGSVRRNRIDSAKYNYESGQLGFAAVRLAVRANVKHVFYDVLRRKEEIQHAEENLRLVEDLRRRTEVQVNVGEAAKLELTRAEAELASARNAVKSARILYIAALSALRAAVSAPLDENVRVEGSLTSSVTLPALDTIRQQILRDHPALKQARAELDRAKATLDYQRALRVPQPSFDVEYEEQPDLGFYRVGLSLPLPIWDKRKGPIAEAVAGQHEAEALQTERRLEITAALERAYGQYQVASQQIAAFEAGDLRQATAAVEAAQAAYKFGERGIIEVLDAQRVLQRIRGEFLDAQFERQSALVDLEELGAVTLGDKN